MTMAIIKVGATFDHLAEERGDYEDWFVEHSGLDAAHVRIVRAQDGEAMPSLEGLSGVIVTGSAALVTDREAWSEATGRFLLQVLQTPLPLLGVCYGHQLLADALGGEVDFNPRGRQMGTVAVSLTEAADADPLFRDLPADCEFQVSHRQSVVALPDGVVHLASSPRDPNHAFRVAGKSVWGVQFHPEFDAETSREYVRQRQDIVRGEGDDPDEWIAQARESDHGPALLRQFATLCGF